MAGRTASIDVYRPVLNVDKADMQKIREALDDWWLPVSNGVSVRMVDDSFPGLRATLISPGEFRVIRGIVKKAMGDEDVSAIADYIYDSLPDNFDEDMHVPTFPTNTNKSVKEDHADLFTISVGVSDRMVAERTKAQEAIRAHLLDRYKIPSYDIFENPVPAYVNAITLRASRADKIAHHIASILERTPDLLPEELVLGPVSIDDM